ncbi:MAG TPA: hypothetical protein PLK40_09020 [Bacteroidaceae bacterium]|nr:hypothetical protein [Bacteroidaceae bacterium]
MKKALCPQCKIPSFYVMNEAGDRRLVYVDETTGEVVVRNEGETLDGFDLSIVYCLGCSWKGAPRKLMKK